MIAEIDWVAASGIATAVATLVLALATFASVRSANRAARAAERSLLANLRPVLMPSRPEDPPQKVGFADDKWFQIPGNQGVAEATDENIYLAMGVRNVGSGIAVLHGWYMHTDRVNMREGHVPLEDFRRLTRDLYVAPGDVAFWQGAFRDPADPGFGPSRAAIDSRQPFGVEVLYGDHELGQRSITYFSFLPRDDGAWFVTVARHWNVDRPDPR